MFKKELVSICTFYAISPIHAGSGASLAAVDLPIQRERHTNWPHIQASAVKGAMRDHYRNFAENAQLINYIFGSDEQDGWDKKNENIAGAVSFSDAKLFAFPMRSNIAPFVNVTCPAVLKRLSNDFEFAGLEAIKDIPNVEKENAVSFCANMEGSIILEDAVVKAIKIPEPPFLQNFPKIDRLLLISDEMFKYCVDSCTEIQTQIKIDSKTGTTSDGSLRYQELLPSDSVLYTVVYYSRASFDNELQAETVRKHIEDTIKNFIQIGGDETLGRGICKINWICGGGR